MWAYDAIGNVVFERCGGRISIKLVLSVAIDDSTDIV